MPVAASEKNEILYEIQNVTQSEDIGFTEIGQGIYLCEGTDGSEYVTGGAEIDLTSEESVNSILSNPYLEQEIKDEVLEAYYLVQNMGQEVECMVYSPDLIPENPEIQPYATIEKYSTYNGLQMKSEIIQLNGLNTGRKRAVAGRGTKNLCSGLKTLVVTALSVAIGEIPVIGSGLSALQAFNDLYGSNIATGSTEDYLEIGLKYDRCNQFTYCQTSPNIWELGLCSQRVTVTKVDVEEYFFNPNLGGKTYNHTWTGSVHLISPNYVNPWQAAYYGVYDMKQEWLSCIVGSLKIQF